MTPFYEQSGIVIYHGDSREVMPRLEARGTGGALSSPIRLTTSAITTTATKTAWGRKNTTKCCA